MTVTAFYPDKHPESTSVDGITYTADVGTATWTIKRDEPGDSASDTGIAWALTVASWAGYWRTISRPIFLFDISSLGSETVTAASFGIVASAKVDSYTDSVAIVSSAPASNTAVVAGDFDSLGETKYATNVTVGNIAVDDSTYSTWTFNSTGIAAVDGASGGIVKLGMRAEHDRGDVEPGDIDNAKRTNVTMHSADESDAGEKRPTLTVTSVVAFTPKAIIF